MTAAITILKREGGGERLAAAHIMPLLSLHVCFVYVLIFDDWVAVKLLK